MIVPELYHISRLVRLLSILDRCRHRGEEYVIFFLRVCVGYPRSTGPGDFLRPLRYGRRWKLAWGTSARGRYGVSWGVFAVVGAWGAGVCFFP